MKKNHIILNDNEIDISKSDPNSSLLDWIRLEKQLHGKAISKGPIKTLDGEILGEHSGIHNYTIGQRKGLNISYEYPLYVIKINAHENSIIVGPKGKLHTSTITLENMSFVNP